jgi:hypothetical protein
MRLFAAPTRVASPIPRSSRADGSGVAFVGVAVVVISIVPTSMQVEALEHDDNGGKMVSKNPDAVAPSLKTTPSKVHFTPPLERGVPSNWPPVIDRIAGTFGWSQNVSPVVAFALKQVYSALGITLPSRLTVPPRLVNGFEFADSRMSIGTQPASDGGKLHGVVVDNEEESGTNAN